VARLAVSRTICVPDAAILAAVFAFSACAGLGASSYCFAAFVLTKQLRYAMAAVGFFALCGGSVLQAIADTSGPTPALYDWIMTVSWLMAALAFAGASHSRTVMRVSGRLQSLLMSVLAGLLVLGFPMAVLTYALDVTVFYAFSADPARAFAAYLIETSTSIAALSLMLLALYAGCRRALVEGDRPSAATCFFLVPCAAALIARAASLERFDGWWICCEVMTVGAWLAFVVMAGVENARAQQEARDHSREMEALHEISWSLVGTRSIEELPGHLARILQERVGARIVAVYLADAGAQALRVAAVAGPDECRNSVGAVYPVLSTDRRPGFHTGHTARAFLSREMQSACDVFVDVELVPWRIIAGEEGCAVSLPMVEGGEAIGVISFYFSDRRELTPQRLRLLLTIAAAVSPSIAHARTDGAERDRVAALPKAA
jgi:hypothetical protein